MGQLLNDIVKSVGGIFVKAVAYVWVIEFQKRGLPHAHILQILDKESKPETSKKIDAEVRAEAQDKDANLRHSYASCFAYTL